MGLSAGDTASNARRACALFAALTGALATSGAPGFAGSASPAALAVAPDDADEAVLLAELLPGVPGRNDYFGFIVDISGDRAVVGAWHEDGGVPGVNGDETDDGAPLSGAAYVFARSGGTWVQEAYLKPDVLDAGDQFGVSVAIDGDTVVVGARREASAVPGDPHDDSALFCGAAYVFVRESGAWSQQAYLKASNADAGDRFGWAVEVEGDTVVVGAIDESSAATGVDGDASDNSAFRAGAAYVFERSGTTWTQQAYLKASNAGVDDRFGVVCKLSGDTLVIGASSEGSGATGVDGDQSDDSVWRAGAAYVFVRDGASWTQQAYLKASTVEHYDYFGKHIALDGDRCVIGAQYEDSSATGVDGDEADNGAVDSGAAYVFERVGTTWSQTAFLKASNTQAGDSFGRSVALSGDRVVIGALGEASSSHGVGADQADDDATSAGAAYVFDHGATGWVQRAYIKTPAPRRGDQFTRAMALDGTRLIVGAHFEDRAGLPDSGAAYVYDVAEPWTAFCAGDGTAGASCPCGNASPTGDVRGCLHSGGVGAALSCTGSTIVGADDATLHLEGARATQPAMFVQGATAISVPFRDGVLCAGNPTERLEFTTTDVSGAAATAGSIVTNGAVAGPGRTRVYQAWFRDPQLSPCDTGSNLSSAVLVRWR